MESLLHDFVECQAFAGSCHTLQSEMIEQEDENFLRSRQDLFTFVKGLSFA